MDLVYPYTGSQQDRVAFKEKTAFCRERTLGNVVNFNIAIGIRRRWVALDALEMRLASRARLINLRTMAQNSTDLGVDDSLLESAARCLDAKSVRALGELKLGKSAKARLDVLAHKANEGQLSQAETSEYDRFIELGDIIATLRLKAERQLNLASAE